MCAAWLALALGEIIAKSDEVRARAVHPLALGDTRTSSLLVNDFSFGLTWSSARPVLVGGCGSVTLPRLDVVADSSHLATALSLNDVHRE